jgi:MULE transposase domain
MSIIKLRFSSCIFIKYILYFIGAFLNTAYSNVVNPLFLANPELAGVMSTASQLKSAYSRSRLRNIPPLPANAIDVQIPEPYRNVQVAGGEEVPFLLVDLSYPTVANGIVDGRILGFCTNEFFRILCAAEHLYMDGTFSICPQIFYQYFTIHTFLGDNKRLIPLLHCLMTGKRQDDYARLFAKLKEIANELGIPFNVRSFMCDFETGLIPAVAAAFPQQIRRGCFYYHANAIFRWVQSRLMVSFCLIPHYYLNVLLQ